MVCTDLIVAEKPPLTPEETAIRLLIIVGVIIAVVFFYNDLKKIIRDTAVELAVASR